jgi:serine acetyltransferase
LDLLLRLGLKRTEEWTSEETVVVVRFLGVLPQVRRIGEGAIIGFGVVVMRDAEDWVFVGGVSARVIGGLEV